MQNFNVVVIGAGAAGMMCAIEAGKRGRKVLVIDHAKKPGEKIRISGGGRCNFTNLDVRPTRFLSQNPHFCKSALRQYSQHDFIAMVEQHHIAFHEKTLGQLFCDESAQEIINMLRDEMAQYNVTLLLKTSIEHIDKNHVFTIQTSNEKIQSDSVVVACGGKSIPKMGASSFGYRIAEQFGLNVTDTRPALVPLTFTDDTLHATKPLSGISVESSVSCGKTSFDEGLLFTHRGLSGPSILQISSYWHEGDEITIDLARNGDIGHALKNMRANYGKQSIQNVLAKLVPAKLADVILQDLKLSGNLADQSNKSIDMIGQALHHWRIKPAGSEGYRTAEVTLGGVDTNDLNSKTMEAKAVPGLYFIGEVVDVTGWLGGYNFQWAWSSGWVAGQHC